MLPSMLQFGMNLNKQLCLERCGKDPVGFPFPGRTGRDNIVSLEGRTGTLQHLWQLHY